MRVKASGGGAEGVEGGGADREVVFTPTTDADITS